MPTNDRAYTARVVSLKQDKNASDRNCPEKHLSLVSHTERKAASAARSSTASSHAAHSLEFSGRVQDDSAHHGAHHSGEHDDQPDVAGVVAVLFGQDARTD